MKKIGRGEGSAKHFIDSIGKFINQLIADVPNKINTLTIEAEQFTKPSAKEFVTCPTCKVGKISLRKNFYGCSNYKNGCKQTFPERLLGKKLTERILKTYVVAVKLQRLKDLKLRVGNSSELSYV